MKRFFWGLLFFFTVYLAGAEQVIDNSFLKYYLKADAGLFKVAYSADDSFELTDFYTMDMAFNRNQGFIFGAGVEKAKNSIHLIMGDLNTKTNSFTTTSMAPYFNSMDKITASNNGNIFIIDSLTEKISYWHVRQLDSPPLGIIQKDFRDLKDIFCDDLDILYILDAGSGQIFRYNTINKQFMIFNNQQESIDYSSIDSSGWGHARDVLATETHVYLIFDQGLLVKLDFSGNMVSKFQISQETLGLTPQLNKEDSQTWLTSMAFGPFGNLYVLDTQDKAVHIFNTDLEYICSWKNNENPIEETANDICFNPMGENLCVCHPWGFYEFVFKREAVQIMPFIAGAKIRKKTINLTPVGSGNLEIKLKGQDFSLVKRENLPINKPYQYEWDGYDKNGKLLTTGNYTLEFYINNTLSREIPLIIE